LLGASLLVVRVFPATPARPTISSFSPAAGSVTAPVTIYGNGLQGTRSVGFNGQSAAFRVVSDSMVRTSVPAGATTGLITLRTGAGTAISLTSFIVSPPPKANYPASTTITGITWTSALRRAGCGDNVPTTWGADNAIYTAFGDCSGFGKLRSSTTVGRVTDTGNPLAFTGKDIWDLREPGGKSGRKISGLIAEGGVLYALFRNANFHGRASQIGYSLDSGITWKFAPWLFTTSMGYPTFVNFGKAGAGAPDSFVYIVSPDSSSAYGPDPARPGMILARVPKDQLLSQSAYQYFTGLAAGRPQWSTDVSRRAFSFTCRNTQCVRGQVSYDAALGRYLWWQQNYVGTVDTRQSGGFGVYEAPNLWGPWHTVYYTTDSLADPSFADPPGESGSFPTKWMSLDGRTVYLVCSCRNAFTVRRAMLNVSANLVP
jgi:hypothetical protein